MTRLTQLKCKHFQNPFNTETKLVDIFTSLESNTKYSNVEDYTDHSLTHPIPAFKKIA